MARKTNRKSTKRAAAPPKGISRGVIVDGSTVLFAGGQKPKVKNLKLVIQKLKEEGYQPTVFVDASRRHDIDDKQAYARMVSQGTIQQVPVHTPADRWILEYAAKHPECKILSSDAFTDWKNEFPWVDDQSRFIRFMIVGDDVMLAGHEPSPPSEKVDLTLVFHDGAEIVTPPKGKGEEEFHDVHEMGNEYSDVIDEIADAIGDSFADCLVRGIRREIRTVAVRAYGRCVKEVKKGVEKFFRELADGEEWPWYSGCDFGIEKTVPISANGMFDTYPGVEIILKMRKNHREEEEEWRDLTGDDRTISKEAWELGFNAPPDISEKGMVFRPRLEVRIARESNLVRGADDYDVVGLGDKKKYDVRDVRIERISKSFWHPEIVKWKGFVSFWLGESEFRNGKEVCLYHEEASPEFSRKIDAWRWIRE